MSKVQGSARDHAPTTGAATPKSAAPDAAAHKRLSDVPADLLGNRLTSSLILLKGDLAKYDEALTHFIIRTRAEAAEDRADLLEALTELVLYHDVPAEAQDPVVVPLLRASFAAIAKAVGTSEPASSGSTSAPQGNSGRNP